MGYAPINLGALSEGGLLVYARGKAMGQLIFKDLVKFEGWTRPPASVGLTADAGRSIRTT